MKYCVNCGDELEGDASFCPNCGYEHPVSLTEKPIEHPLERASIPLKQPQSIKKKNRKDDITDTIGCILLIGAIVVLIILYSIFQELADLIIGIIVTIIVISCLFRLIFGSIGELMSRRKKKNIQKQKMMVQ